MDTRRTKLLFGGLIGLSAFAIVQIASTPKTSLDIYLTVAIIFFAVSLPLLVLGILISYFKENYKKTFEEPKIIDLILNIGVVFCFFGIISLFWHFEKNIAIMFICSSAIAALAFLYWDKKIKALNFKT